MNWRKIFNKPNKFQKEILDEERRLFHNLVCEKVTAANLEIEKAVNIKNSRCPKCGGIEIGNKINSVAINNTSAYIVILSCKKCRNEWLKHIPGKKYNYNIIDEIKTELFNDIPTATIFSELVDFHAETLYYVLHNNCSWINNSILPLKELRKYFKSIYDERNN